MENRTQATLERSRVKAIPEGYRTVTPYLCVKGAAQAIEFYTKALGATEVGRLPMPDGRLGHAEVRIGDSMLMLSDEFPEFGNLSPQTLGGSPVAIHVYGEDVDALAAQVAAAGIPVSVEQKDYGDRAGAFQDPFGHNWYISTHKVDMTAEDYQRRATGGQLPGPNRELEPAAQPVKPVPEGFHTLTPYLTVADGAKAIEFYAKAFGARENTAMHFADPGGRIAHAEITIGDSKIMLNGASEQYKHLGPEVVGGSPVTIALYVEDVDAVAARAAEAGAKIVRPVSDQFYGDRSGRLQDPFGHIWIISTHIEDVTPEEIARRAAAFTRRPAVESKPAEAATKPARHLRAGYHTVTPYLTAKQAPELIEFVKQAFGAEQTFCTTGAAGGVHAEVRLGDSMLMIGGGGAWQGTPLPSAIHLYVPETDAVYQRALALGAISLREPADMDYGERSASVRDLAGNHWYIATHLGPNYIPKGLRTANVYLHPHGADKLIDFMKQALGAEEVARYLASDGVIGHAEVRIGDSVIEMGEAHGPHQPMPTMFYLYVEDCDTLYKRALQAGGRSIAEPTNQHFGDRNCAVKDPFENVWYLATHVKDLRTS